MSDIALIRAHQAKSGVIFTREQVELIIKYKITTEELNAALEAGHAAQALSESHLECDRQDRTDS